MGNSALRIEYAVPRLDAGATAQGEGQEHRFHRLLLDRVTRNVRGNGAALVRKGAVRVEAGFKESHSAVPGAAVDRNQLERVRSVYVVGRLRPGNPGAAVDEEIRRVEKDVVVVVP